mmetsp:Transcript_18150/g.32500  ORF Transcript_18150/g.32500 Transcript_18150/m.32500 type:complete len:517 (-) Transcript_18150:3989-5539(-)
MNSLQDIAFKATSTGAALVKAAAKPIVDTARLASLSAQEIIFKSVRQALSQVNRTQDLDNIVQGLEQTAVHLTTSILSFSELQANFAREILENVSDFFEHQVRSYGQADPNTWPFSRENRKLLTETSEFLKVQTAECEGIPISFMWQALTAWSIAQRVARETLWTFHEDPGAPSQWRVEEATYYSKYSVGIYGKSLVNMLMNSQYMDLFKNIPAKQILATYAGIPEEDIVLVNSDSQPFMPSYAVCIDKAQRAIVIVIRGTLAITDCLTDLKADYMPYSIVDPFTLEVKANGTVHEGMFKGALNVFNAVKPLVLEMQALYGGYSIIVAGHSLGGGTAALIGLIMKSDIDFVGRGFRVYAYGAPCVVSREIHPFTKDYSMTISLGADLVTRVCYGSIKDLASLILFFKQREGIPGQLTASQIVKNTILNKPTDPNELIAVYLQAKRQLTNMKHFPSGFILQIYDKHRNSDTHLLPASDKQYTVAFALPSFYSEIVFAKTVLSDHMPEMYERALSNLL